MSVRVMTDVWAIDLPDSDKIVLLALADCANDEGGCWPSMATLAKKCSKSERTVQGCIKRLVDTGHLTRAEKLGKGCNYTVHPRRDCAPAAAAPPQGLPPTPAAAADKPSRTIKLPKKSSTSRVARMTSYPENFSPQMTGKTLSSVEAWPPGRLADELEAFADHHTSHGTLSKCWQASWRTWVRFSKKWDQRDGRQRREPRPDPLMAALRVAEQEERAERDQADHPGTRLALPANLGGHA